MSRKAKLTSKRRRTERFRFEVADPHDAQMVLAEARLAFLRAKDTDDEPAAKAALDQAVALVDECFDYITLRALRPSQQLAFQQELTELRAADDAAAEADPDAPRTSMESRSSWDADSYEVRMIAACDADERSPEEWAEAFADDAWSLQDRADLLDVCYEVNGPRQPYDLGILGKG